MTRTPAFLSSRLEALSHPAQRSLRDALILDALGDPSPAVRDVAVAWAARCLEPGELLPCMADDADAVLRNAALAALERQGPYAVEAVGRLTSDPDPDVAMFACQVLGGIGSVEATPSLLVALARPEVNLRQAAAEAAGRLRARDTVPALISLMEREPWLQLAAVDALGAIGDERAVEPLLALVPESFVAAPALDALRRIGSSTPLARLLPLLTAREHEALRVPLIRAIGGCLRDAAPSAELLALGRDLEGEHEAGSAWRLLADRLSGEEDDQDAAPAGPDDRSRLRGGGISARGAGAITIAAGVASLYPLLIRRATDADWAAWIVPLARRFGTPAGAAAIALLSHGDPEVRAGTLRVVPAAAIGARRLLVLLEDVEEAVRVAALDALGELADDTTAPALGARIGSAVAAERAAAAQALARLSDPAVAAELAAPLAVGAPEAAMMAALSVLRHHRVAELDDRVLALVRAPSPALRRAALRAAAVIPGSTAEVVLFRALADREGAVQVEALELLVGHGGPRVRATLLAMLGIADSLRYHVIRALGRLGAVEAAAPLETLFGTAPLHEQLEILTALERIGNARSREFLAECLGHSHVEIRRAAAQGLASLAGADDMALLHQLATSSDWVLRSEAARACGRLQLPAGRPLLLDLVRDLEPVVARTARAALAGST